MNLEEIITKKGRFTIEDFEYITRPNHTVDEENAIRTFSVYIKGIYPKFEDESADKINILRSKIDTSDFKGIEKIYNSSLEFFTEKDPEIARFNVIFGYLLVKATEKPAVTEAPGDKKTYDIWKKQNSLFAGEDVWDLLEYGLSFVMNRISVIKKDSLEIYDFLCPEYTLYSLITVYSIRESAIINDKSTIDAIADLVISIGDIGKSREYIISKYSTSGSEFSWEEMKRAFEGFLPDQIAKNGGDRKYISKLESIFTEQGNISKVTAHDLLNSTIDYLMTKRDFEKVANDIVDLHRKISDKVIGQDMAVRKFINGLFNGLLRSTGHLTGPMGCYLFVGPPGVGKTYLAQTASGLLNRPSKLFDMSEYAHNQAFQGLVGFEKSFSNSAPGELTDYVDKNRDAVLIFDEIEKAHVNTIRIFLSILEGGYLKDIYTDNDVDFTHTVLIFTTNAGRQFYEEKRGMSISSLPEATLLDALRSDIRDDGTPVMPPEMLSRLSKGNIIGFDHMEAAKLIPIIKAGMRKGAEVIRDTMGIESLYDRSLLPFLFLYHMGGNLDARIASARSESFIKDNLFHIAERVGEDSGKFGAGSNDKRKIRMLIDVEENSIARELTEPERAFELLAVCSPADSDMLKQAVSGSRYDYFIHHIDIKNENDDYVEQIRKTLKTRNIDAILVDPLMGSTAGPGGEELEGIGHKNTAGNRAISRLLDEPDHPPVFCIEFKDHHIGYFDQLDLHKKGIREIIRLSEAKDDSRERSKMIEDLCYELFLTRKLSEITRKGKSLEFDVGHRIEQDQDSVDIRLFLRNFRLIRAMDSEAQEIFIDEEISKKEGFDSVIGCDSAKEELKRFVKYVKDPEQYSKSGQQISKGILMYGPPGTGKTMLARAMACEADCPFISVTGSQFVFGEKRITDVFRLARKYAPSIVFIDEIESIAMDRSVGGQYTELLKALLTEMDGFRQNSDPIFVIAATNAAKAPNLGEKNIFLDDALLRRFTKRVYLALPSRQNRIEFIVKIKRSLAGKEYNLDNLTDQDIEEFAGAANGTSLAELSNIINIAISRAAENGEQVTKDALHTCFEEYIYGEKHEYALDHVWKTAVHEAGHAFVSFYCDGFAPGRFTPEYATIIARGSYLGVVHTVSDESHSGYSRDELIKLIRIKLAGRAAEIVFEGETNGLTTGASNDLNAATGIVSRILSMYGMEDGFMASFDPKEMMNSPMAHEYYSRLNDILRRELDETISIIKQNKAKVSDLAVALCEYSKLDTNKMLEIINAV